MKINVYRWTDLSDFERAGVLARVQAQSGAADDTVRQIVEDVRVGGDEALLAHTARLDAVTLTAERLVATDEEFAAAERAVDPALRDALRRAHRNIERFHVEQSRGAGWMKEIEPGVLAGERATPVSSVALYVPRGKGSFPSVMLMLCVPAVIAEVPDVVVCTPPGPDGTLDAASLVAARMCGVRTVYKMGGAQAVAALAYGTGTVRRVDKIVGPGNQFVAAAKRLVAGVVDPGPPAGPSESVILADEAADPQVVAREWLVEAEHGSDSAALVVTGSTRLVDSLLDVAETLARQLPAQRRKFVEDVLGGYGGIVVTDGLDAAVDFVNEFAPEHLRVLTAEPMELLPRIRHAAEVLLGEYASIPFGNFSIGLNAILPTGGRARTQSAVGVHTFQKFSSFAYVTAEGARSMGPTAAELARWEGFPAHGEAVRHAVERADKV